MKRRIAFFYVLCLVLVACSSPTGFTPTVPIDTSDPTGPISSPHEAEPTLLKSYHFLRIHEDGSTEKQVDRLSYRPYDPFGRWDRLEWPTWHGRDLTQKDWLFLSFNRDATVAVIWEGEELPSWLEAWTEGQSVEEGKRSFSKVVSTGSYATLGAPEGKGDYYVLLGEADGSSPQKPPVPSGEEAPLPNTQCPDWVHDQYGKEHPADGRMYNTWHPQVDPVYWCYFGHEHGSDPSQIGYTAYYNYVAYHNNNQHEQHEGFKGFSLKDGAVNWYVNIHATSGMHRRICVPLHTVVVAALGDDGELLAELSFKGDFGESRANSGNGAVITNPSSDCNQVALEQQDTKAEKRVRVLNDGRYSDSGYEQWRMIGHDFLGLEFNSDVITMDIRNPVTGCQGLSCRTAILTNPDPEQPTVASNNGERRTLNFHQGIKITYNRDLDLSDGKEDGYFYTDAKGTKTVSASSPEAVRQFVKPGLNLAGPTDFHASQDAWFGLYTNDNHHVPRLELEQGLEAMN